MGVQQRYKVMKRTGAKILLATALFAAVVACVNPSIAQTTNWIAYNDHRAGPSIPPHIPATNNWGTHVRASRYDMGAAGDTTAAVLTNFLDGQALPVTMSATRTGAPDDFGTVSAPPRPNTPAARVFYGKVDLSNNGIVGVDADVPNGVAIDYVTITFNGLNPDKRYNFRGTSNRGGNYAFRWSVCQILAEGYIDAHENGTAGTPGVLTSNQYPAFLSAGQAAWNSGDNVEGDVVGWDFIDPYADGSFSLVVSQYVGMTPGGMANDVNYGYSFGAIMLAEIEATAVDIVTDPPAQTTVLQNRPFSIGVTATGSPRLYQWYKDGVELAGETFPTLSRARAALSDSGSYRVVVHNPINRETSSVAQVTVEADLVAPAVDIAFSYGELDTNDLSLPLNQVILDFNEAIDPTTAGNPLQYDVSTIGNPSAVTVTGEQTVMLSLPSALAEDTDYTVQVTGVRDLAGNLIVASSTPFRSWMRSPGNGMQFEAFTSGSANDLSVLKSSPNFPNNPYLRSNIWIMDTRAVYPDDTVEGYGGRLRGVFIPPVSGQWLFYFRTFERGEVNLNPNGMDPANVQLMVQETTGNNPRPWNKFASPLQSLRAGRGYYIEALYQAGAGADVIKVAARLVGTPPPATADTPHTPIDTNALHGAAVGGPLAPRDFGGALTIVQQPADATVEENNLATFSVQVDNPSRLPLSYQWYKDGVAIPGSAGGLSATLSFYVTAADNNTKYKAEISKIGSFVTSAEATLTVVADTTAPRALSAENVSANTSNIVIKFSERINQGQAEDPFNYGFLPATILSATLEADAKTVTIMLDAGLTPGQTYTIDVSGIPDLANNPMVPITLVFIGASDLPKLEIARDNGNVILSWPAPSTGFILDESPQLEPATWAPVSGTPTVVNGRNTLSQTIGTANRVYRLRRP